ncbi:MAG: FecCD family ABC transporter permease [Acidimicrobiales bacterium]
MSGRSWVWPAAVAASLAAVIVGTLVGPVRLPLGGILTEVADRLPLVHVRSGLDEREAAILWQIRLPRVVLGFVVGSMLSVAGTAYQGVFRNPLADPYLLGAAAGAGLGATLVITGGVQAGLGPLAPLPVAAFVGALVAVSLTYSVGTGRDRRSTASLLLAGVAVTSLLTAVQTYLQQRSDDTVRQVYSWILGRLSTAAWADVVVGLPWAVLATVVVFLHRRNLDVLAVGDEEATTLGLRVDRTRLVVVAAASLGTAAAVAVSGLIGFVGIIVPHTVRLMVGTGHRSVLPLALVLGGGFLVAADLAARTVASPGEIPIGVVTALVGAPFFLVLLAQRHRDP